MNKRGGGGRLTSAPLAPVLKMVVLDVAGYDTPQGNWRLRVLNGLCTREFNGLRSVHPTFRAHLRRTFLIMSVADITYTPCFDQMHRLREGAGETMRRYHRAFSAGGSSFYPGVFSFLSNRVCGPLKYPPRIQVKGCGDTSF